MKNKTPKTIGLLLFLFSFCFCPFVSLYAAAGHQEISGSGSPASTDSLRTGQSAQQSVPNPQIHQERAVLGSYRARAVTGPSPEGSPLRSQRGVGRDFVWAQLDMGSGCDPYPDVHPGILKFTADVTSITIDPVRKLLKLDDDEIFSYPFMVLACKSAPRSLTDSEIRRLRLYLISGGTLWIEDCLAARHTAFDRWVRRTVSQVFPDIGIEQLGRDHPVFRSFFLLRSLGGRSIVHASVEGINWGPRTAVIYSRNDLLGVWMKDAFGKPLYPCIPGGEVQRMNGKKLVLNIIMYSLTGSYKLDAVHQPFIMQKLRARDAMP